MFSTYKTIISFVVISLLCGSPSAFSKTDPKGTVPKTELIAKLDEIARFQAKKLGVPGVAFGVVLNGEVVLKTTVGTRRVLGNDPVNSETLFQIGSIAKTFAAVAAVKLHLQNKLKLDEPIEKYLPSRCTEKRCEGITIRHLLSHTSGIPATGVNESIESGEGYETVVSKVTNAKKVCAPGRCFRYNNVAYELVREILGKAEGLPYVDILKNQLLAPLKFDSTTLTFEELKRGGNYFFPHIFRNGHFEEIGHSTAYYAYPGSGAPNSNLDDMMKLVAAELGYAPAGLSAEALAILHEPATEAPDAYAWFQKPPPSQRMVSRYALGHRVLTSPDLTVVFHTGWIKGCKSMMAVFPERSMGFVLLQNSESQLGFRVLEDIIRYLRTGRVK